MVLLYLFASNRLSKIERGVVPESEKQVLDNFIHDAGRYAMRPDQLEATDHTQTHETQFHFGDKTGTACSKREMGTLQHLRLTEARSSCSSSIKTCVCSRMIL